MNTQFDIQQILAQGTLKNELELERAMIADRKLRSLAKENPKFKSIRRELRDLIESYENDYWSAKSKISDKRLKDSDTAEVIAEEERLFLKRRKEVIRNKIKELDMNQQELGKILGHSSKSYMSELMNGLSPFSLKDLIVIHRLLKIDLRDLIPTTLSLKERNKIESSVEKLNNPKLKLSADDFKVA